MDNFINSYTKTAGEKKIQIWQLQYPPKEHLMIIKPEKIPSREQGGWGCVEMHYLRQLERAPKNSLCTSYHNDLSISH